MRRRRPMFTWTPEADQRLHDLLASGHTQGEVARAIDIDISTVGRRCRELHLSPGYTRQVSARVQPATSPAVDIPITVEEPAEDPNPRELMEKLVKLTKRGADLEELCDRMDLPPRRVRDLVEEARRLGFTVDIAGPHVGHRPAASAREPQAVVAQATGRGVFAVVSDLHFGSLYHLNAQLHDFVKIAHERGVRTVLLPGDVLEGCYRHAQWELSEHGFYDQANACARGLPAHPGLTYHFITGNHDQTFADANGMNIGHALVEVFRSSGRSDLVFHGERGASVAMRSRPNERGLVVEMWHPLKGPAYALSYKLQKHVEGYAVGFKPDCLFAGHWHQSVYFTTRGVHAFSAGTFQGGGGPFGKALGGSPSIGGWIVEYGLTEHGTVRRLAPEWIGYFESERPRDIAV